MYFLPNLLYISTQKSKFFTNIIIFFQFIPLVHVYDPFSWWLELRLESSVLSKQVFFLSSLLIILVHAVQFNPLSFPLSVGQSLLSQAQLSWYNPRPCLSFIFAFIYPHLYIPRPSSSAFRQHRSAASVIYYFISHVIFLLMMVCLLLLLAV